MSTTDIPSQRCYICGKPAIDAAPTVLCMAHGSDSATQPVCANHNPMTPLHSMSVPELRGIIQQANAELLRREQAGPAKETTCQS